MGPQKKLLLDVATFFYCPMEEIDRLRDIRSPANFVQSYTSINHAIAKFVAYWLLGFLFYEKFTIKHFEVKIASFSQLDFLEAETTFN